MSRDSYRTVRTPDGLDLASTLTEPEGEARRAVVLVQGASVTREEGGFFTRLADNLAEADIASLRIDLPGHGESEGRQEELTLSALLNVIRGSLEHLSAAVPGVRTSLAAASFSGGAAAYYAAKRPDDVERLILFNPLLDYRRRFIEEKPEWSADGYLNDKASADLKARNYLGHGPGFRLGRGLLNEAFWFEARETLPHIAAPTLIVHGTEDTFVPVESSRAADRELTCEHRLLQLDGAQHGFAVHDDPGYADPRTRAWQRQVIREVREWLR
ncbi:alpha-beta hydrolase superfamily lysophospholipase [Amycolatopsis echigonensis]|uniref:Alpha-beta hydrolase superfamily lysophospholipase n=1 Tax=Amycolatopsis echigonensis TaxID=2576905 RepID=A0A2N3WV60_9PSEU|nr:alpha/beta fold hydrolase [Amycolatopsis niigatensis]PKV97766.1 alpha-beta hydrolase superfamily lysophospholipase [Amycolatopsis niigatensis]